MHDLPPSVTQSGKIRVDFAGSARLVHPEGDPWHDPQALRAGDVFTGTVVHASADGFSAFVAHPKGFCGQLILRGRNPRLAVDDKVRVRIRHVDRNDRSLDLELA